jgi:uroporphyrinogen-III synthase
MTVLSTKILTVAQRSLLLNANVALVEYNAITINRVPFVLENTYRDIILSSQNAVYALLNKLKDLPSSERAHYHTYCVGEKTRDLLRKEGLSVVESGQYGAELALKLVERHSKSSFLFLCGDKRHDALPDILDRYGVTFKEVQVYGTQPCPKRFHWTFKGVLFFSPSAVSSYTSANPMGNSIAFCIGNTTAEEAKKHTDAVIVAKKPTIENVLVQVIKKFNNQNLGKSPGNNTEI